MNMYKIVGGFFVLLFLFLYPLQSFSSGDSSAASKKQLEADKKITIKKNELLKALELSDRMLVNPLSISGSRHLIYSVERFCTLDDIKTAKNLIWEQRRALKNDVGIKLRAGMRSSSGNLNLYNNSAFAGFSWDIVKGGLLENRVKAKELSLRQSLSLQGSELQRRRLLSLCKQNFISYYFSKLKIPILKEKIGLLEQLMKIKKEGYFYGIELADSLIKIKSGIGKAKAELNQFEQLVESYCTVEKWSFCKYDDYTIPPVLSIRFKRVMSQLEHVEASKEMGSLNKNERLLRLKEDWRHNVKIEAYLYYSTKGDSSFYSKQGFIGGVNLSIPIGTKDEQVDKLKLTENQNSFKRERSYLESYTNLLYREEEEKVSDTVNMWYGMDIALERIRRESYKLKSELKNGGVSYRDYVALLENLKNYLDGEFEFISSEGLLYRRITNLLTVAGVDWKDKLKEVELNPLGNRFRVGKRYVLLKKSEVELLSSGFVASLLYTKGIKGAIMKKNLFETEKGKELMRSLKGMGIKSYVLYVRDSKEKGIPMCLSVEKLNKVASNWHCVIFDGKTDKNGLKELLKKTDMLFVPQKEAFFHSGKLGIIVNLKHISSELELENRLDKLYRSGIKMFLFDFGKLMNIYSGGVN